MTALFVVLLIIGGFVFLVVEIFVVPGFSVPGIAGLMMIGYGIFKASQAYGGAGAFVTIAVSLLSAVVMIRIALRSKAFQAFGLDSSVKGARALDDYEPLLGKTGTASSDLRPAGTAMIDGIRCDVVTDGEYIARDTTIRVVDVDGGRIVVAEAGGTGEE